MFLVTTADESTWNTNRPLLFLGEWCRRFSRRDQWQTLDNKMHPYHWDDRQKYYNDYRFLEKKYEEKLASLSVCLGNMHGVSTDNRYWRIIIGPWLRFFIDALFDRFELIRTAAETENIDDTWIQTYRLDDWIPSDFQDFYCQFRDDPWNHIIFSECILANGIPFTIRDTLIVPNNSDHLTKGLLRRIIKFILGLYGFLLPLQFNEVSIIAAYMPRCKLWKLQRSLGQLPYFSSPVIRINNKQPDHKKREMLFFEKAVTPFEQLLNRLIKALIPYSYIENYAALKAKSLKLFPMQPKLILTANAYQADDGFKVWAAHYVNKKVPLVLEQHGGHFGVGLLNQTEDHQLLIADVFASWGWKSEEHTNVRSMPALKLNSELTDYNRNGDILLITASYPRYFYCHFSCIVAGQMIDYIEQHVEFSKMLAPSQSSSLRIRTDTDIFGWDIHERLKAAGIGWAIDTVQKDLIARLKDCRIAVITYNATVFLETLAANFPTIVFFDPDRYEIRPTAKPMMESLRKVGILHYTPESAAHFLNTIGTGIEKWWNDEVLQETRYEFCSVYASTSTRWVDEWSIFLRSLVKNN